MVDGLKAELLDFVVFSESSREKDEGLPFGSQLQGSRNQFRGEPHRATENMHCYPRQAASSAVATVRGSALGRWDGQDPA